MKLSRLGFGAMRLPMVDVDGKSVVDDDKAIPAIHRAFELGVNYIDTAWGYCNELSEVTVGKAVNSWGRDRVHVSSKYPFNGSFREILEKQLTKLNMDYLDIYHLHGIGAWFVTDGRREDVVAQAMAAKEEGLIRNLSFSFHDEPKAMVALIDTGLFASVLCQYNILDKANEDSLAYAKEKGLGTIVMGPLGGGRIIGMSPEIAVKMGVSVSSNAELALRSFFPIPMWIWPSPAWSPSPWSRKTLVSHQIQRLCPRRRRSELKRPFMNAGAWLSFTAPAATTVHLIAPRRLTSPASSRP